MPLWGTIALTVASVWLLAAVVLAFAIGRAIHLADQRSPRKRRTRDRSKRGRRSRADR